MRPASCARRAALRALFCCCQFRALAMTFEALLGEQWLCLTIAGPSLELAPTIISHQVHELMNILALEEDSHRLEGLDF